MTFPRLLTLTAFVLGVLLPCTRAEPAPRLIMSIQCDVGQNPQWAPFADYLQDITSRVQGLWAAARHKRNLPDEDITVTIALTLSKYGEVTYRYLDTQASDKEAQACLEAVKQAGPFPVWTVPMRKTLQDSEDVALVFATRRGQNRT